MVLLLFDVAEYRHQSSLVMMYFLFHLRMVAQRSIETLSGFIASEKGKYMEGLLVLLKH